MSYRYRTIHMVYVGLGALPFVIWRFRSHSIWPDVFVAAYLLTAWLFLTLMIGYPGAGNRWYWKPVAVMFGFHSVLLSMLTMGAVAVLDTGIKPPTALLFTLVILLLAMESWIALRVIERFLERTERR